MATVTPNFNWPVPTSTDLVKDGATAIEALGDSIDASLVDLKGGTTGQVLSKTSGTDMDFTWVTSDDANAIQNTIVDAKGDLISASAADTPARLAVGNNGETLVADSSTSTGLKWGYGKSHAVSIYASGAQSLANSTFTALTATNEYFDTDGYHSTSVNTSRITIPAGLAGKYLVQGQVNWDKSATGGRVASIYLNGASVVPGLVTVGSSAEYVGCVVTSVLSLNVGDYVELYARQNSGGNLNAYIDAASGFFNATFLGA